jgi:hypothetical protein
LKCARRFHVTNVRFFVACVKYIFTFVFHTSPVHLTLPSFPQYSILTL